MFFKKNNQRIGLEVGYLSDKEQVKYAAEILAHGGLVATQMGNVFGIFLDAANKKAVNKKNIVKGQSTPQPLSIMMQSAKLVDLLDKDAIHSDLKLLVEDAQNLSVLVGGICHLRAPVIPNKNKRTKVPETIISHVDDRFYVHSLDPSGYPNMEKFVQLVNGLGVKFLGVTSLNTSGVQKEIHTWEGALAFCVPKSEIDILMIDDENKVDLRIKGSYAILDLVNASYVRDGQIPVRVIDKIIGQEISSKTKIQELKTHKYTHEFDFDSLLKENLSPQELRKKILGIHN